MLESVEGVKYSHAVSQVFRRRLLCIFVHQRVRLTTGCVLVFVFDSCLCSSWLWLCCKSNTWEHLCCRLNYSLADTKSKIWTETHWPFLKKKNATSFKWDTFSSSFTSQFSLKINLISFPCSLMSNGFPQNETIHCAFLIRLIMSRTWRLVYWLDAVALAQVYLLQCGSIDYSTHICSG